MAEPRRESTSSLQRKKPPWLRLDIPAAQGSVEEPPTFVQVTLAPLRASLFLPVLLLLGLANVLPAAPNVTDAPPPFSPPSPGDAAGEEAGLPAQHQYAGGDHSPAVAAPGLLLRHPAARPAAPVVHHSDHQEVSGRRRPPE